MNCTSVKVIYIILFLFLPNRIFAQDSLYLITSFTGKNAINRIISVSSLGDINGDKYDEFAIKLSNTDYFSIYIGSDSLDIKNRIQFNAPVDLGVRSGIGKYMGDINSDGFDDFMLSGSRDEIFFLGKAFLYLGGEIVDNTPDFSFYASGFIEDGVTTGTSGDFNNDGYDDFTITNAYNFTDGIGRVYLFKGGSSIVDTPYVTFISDSIEDFYGVIASLEGDINGDGFNDLIISAPYLAGINNFSVPRGYIYLGGESMNSNHDFYIDIPQESNIDVIGDFNNDSYSDFFVTISNKLYFGDETFNENNFIEFSSNQTSDSFGETSGSIGDINNDGFDDLILGATNHKNLNGVMVGGAYIFLGSSHPNSTPDFFLEGETKWSHFGKKVGSLGDLNGDGFDEIYVLADGYPDSENPLGKVYIYSIKKILVNVEEEKQTKVHYNFNLFQNYPNPFNPSTTLSYQIPANSYVNLTVYNSLGQTVSELVNEYQSEGKYSLEFDANNLSNGIYFYKLVANNYSETKKMMLLK